MAKMNKKTLTKHDLLRAIKGISMQIEVLQNHIMMIDNVLDKYIHMNKDEDKLQKYLIDLAKKEKEKAEEKLLKNKSDEHKQEKRKQSGRSAKVSK